MNILIAPSGFKESLDASEAACAIERGIQKVAPEARTIHAPLVDGGEGFTKALVEATGGTLHEITVTGPVGQPVKSHFGFLGSRKHSNAKHSNVEDGNEGESGPRTAVLEMAAAAGLRLVPRDQRNPLQTTTYGVGELIRAAIDAGAERILVGCGDSGTNDGGAGMAQALGVRLLDSNGQEIGRGGAALTQLHQIDMSNLHPGVQKVQIDVACNWHNLLCGAQGVARVFGPQKGASPETVEQLATALDNYADRIEAQLGIDVHETPGSGASGGLGAGLVAFLGATLHPRFDIVMQYLNFDELLHEVDLVITAEGAIDFQTPRGKVPAEVARRAKVHGLPVVAIAGTIGQGAEANYSHGIDAITSILEAPCSLEDAIAQGDILLERAAERVMRKLLIGQQMMNRRIQQFVAQSAFMPYRIPNIQPAENSGLWRVAQR